MIVAWIAVIVAVVGALVYALAVNPKLAELGRLSFLAAMIGLMVACATRMVTLVG